MSELPLVSVVIPAYNSGSFITTAIQSVRRQTYPHWELLVVDDGSTDKTSQKVRAVGDPRVRLFRQQHSGVAAARNKAMSNARGAYIAFLDADDIWLPDKLDTQVRYFKTLGREVGLVHSNYYQVEGLSCSSPIVVTDDEVTGDESNRSYTQSANPFFRLLLCNYLRTPTVMIRSSIVERVGKFDVRLTTAEDWDLWLRIASQYQIARVPEKLTCIRSRTGSLSDHPAQLALDKLRVTCKHAFKSGVTDEVRTTCIWNRYKDLADLAYKNRSYIESLFWYLRMMFIKPLALENFWYPSRKVLYSLWSRFGENS